MRAAAACCVLTATCGVLPLRAFAQSQAAEPPPTAAATAAALEQSGLTFRKASAAVWVVTFTSSSSTPIDVIINAQKDLVVVFAVVARTPALAEEQLRDLLRENYSANFAKLAIDDDGDLLAMNEIPARGLTVPLLRASIEEVAKAGDAAARLVRPPPGGASEHGVETVPSGHGATLSLVSGAFELAYDPRKWKPRPGRDSNVTELVHVSGEAYLNVIAGRDEIDADRLARVALSSARTTSDDVRIVSEAWRMVNGLRTLVLRLDGMANGARFSSYNQVYSDASGTVQLAGRAGVRKFDAYRRDFLEIFAGFRKVAGRRSPIADRRSPIADR